MEFPFGTGGIGVDEILKEERKNKKGEKEDDGMHEPIHIQQ